MLGRFIRFASLGFTLFSAIYWMGIVIFGQIILAIDGQTEIAAGTQWAIQAVPVIVYGLICVLSCHWSAKSIVRRIDIRAPFE